jgi:hypothetical protein
MEWIEKVQKEKEQNKIILYEETYKEANEVTK